MKEKLKNFGKPLTTEEMKAIKGGFTTCTKPSDCQNPCDGIKERANMCLSGTCTPHICP